MGLGIARGAVVAGTAGSAQRAAYACVGAPVQRAVMLESESWRSGRKVLMDAVTHAGLSGQVAAAPVALSEQAPVFTIA